MIELRISILEVDHFKVCSDTIGLADAYINVAPVFMCLNKDRSSTKVLQ